MVRPRRQVVALRPRDTACPRRAASARAAGWRRSLAWMQAHRVPLLKGGHCPSTLVSRMNAYPPSGLSKHTPTLLLGSKTHALPSFWSLRYTPTILLALTLM